MGPAGHTLPHEAQSQREKYYPKEGQFLKARSRRHVDGNEVDHALTGPAEAVSRTKDPPPRSEDLRTRMRKHGRYQPGADVSSFHTPDKKLSFSQQRAARLKEKLINEGQAPASGREAVKNSRAYQDVKVRLYDPPKKGRRIDTPLQEPGLRDGFDLSSKHTIEYRTTPSLSGKGTIPQGPRTEESNLLYQCMPDIIRKSDERPYSSVGMSVFGAEQPMVMKHKKKMQKQVHMRRLTWP